MQTLTIHDGAQPETPRFAVTLKHDAGRVRIIIAAEGRAWGDKMPSDVFDAPIYQASDIAIHKACKHERAPFRAFVAVHVVNPTPDVPSRYGAPMGRVSASLDLDGPAFRASRVPLDSGGYDRGGAYWGIRPRGVSLYAVQDGSGNVAFFDAPSSADAIAQGKDA